MENTGDITILDGAMGTELRARGVKVPDYQSSIWSALALIEAPEAIVAVHQDYIRAGADVITVNNYAVTSKLLARENMAHRLAELTLLACELAVAARDKVMSQNDEQRNVRIAGSLPPLDTSYRYDLVGSFAENIEAYDEMARLLAPHVDILLCETMTTAEEARAAATAAANTGKPVWVSWTLKSGGGRLRGGDDIATAVKALDGLPIDAMLFNCCAAEPIAASLAALHSLTSKPIGAYCNPVLKEPAGGAPQPTPSEKLNADDYARVVAEWLSLGATIVGGCCDTSPAHIAAISRLARSGARTIIDPRD
jgi:S-methylmethionine-dependent homocysteine/selenocysteine methylase